MSSPSFVRLVLRLLSALVLLAFSQAAALAQAAPAAAPPPEKVQQLLDLLADPSVKTWLETKAPPAPPAATAEGDVAGDISEVEALIRNHMHGLVAAVPRIPSEFARGATIISNDVNAGTPGKGIFILAVLIGIGYGAEWLFRRLLRAARDRRAAALGTASEAGRGFRFLSELAPLVVFALASAGLFLAFEWPPLFRKVVLTFLVAFIAFRILRAITLLLLSPLEPAPEGAVGSTRLLDVDTDDARFWFSRVSWIAGIFLGGWALTSLMPSLGFSPEVRLLIAYALGLVILGIAIETVWHRPSFRATGSMIRGWLLTAALVVLWLIWFMGFTGIFWLGVYALVLPKAVRGIGRAAEQMVGDDKPAGLYRRLINVLIVRGARAAVIAAAVAWLAYVWQLRTAAIGESPVAERIVEGLLHGVIILLIADLLWQLSKVYIEYRLDLATQTATTPDEIARSGRLRTLLPIFRNTLAVFIACVAVLTVLAGMGVQIAPLIAGAGIFGVAIGFGSQTLVKDVLSGVFFMLDDAFRVGEYIQSGSYKGTVESFSLRSVRLRHHRGPIFTVPFGSLGAVQNMSRDWVVEKMTVNVTYDSDVELARKIVKKIGLELAEDPEFAASTLQPLKMQGVDNFGESAIVLSMKMMTRPGEQFGMKRKAWLRIKKAFDENGIKIATPSIQVSGGGDDKDAGAAAAEALRRKKAADAAAAAAE